MERDELPDAMRWEDLARLAELIADEPTLRLLAALERGDGDLAALVERAGLAASPAARIIGELCLEGLVLRHGAGARARYSLASADVMALVELLLGLADTGPGLSCGLDDPDSAAMASGHLH